MGSVFLLSFAVGRDGVHHLVDGSAQESFRFEIRLLDLPTGKDRVLQEVELRPTQGLTVSPDGETILYSAVAADNEDLMLVENFRRSAAPSRITRSSTSWAKEAWAPA
jgi:hypothetical protein